MTDLMNTPPDPKTIAGAAADINPNARLRDVWDVSKLPIHDPDCALMTTHHLTCTCGAHLAVSMRWTHPTLGRIAEDLCQRHEQEVLAALQALAIGCVGERSAALARDCSRCLAEARGQSVREYLTGRLDL